IYFIILVVLPPPPSSIPFPYTTLFRSILGLEKVSVTSDFFELGGHSLLGTQMFARIKHHFSINIGLRKLFEAPTIRKLATLIQRSEEHTSEPQSRENLVCRLLLEKKKE